LIYRWPINVNVQMVLLPMDDVITITTRTVCDEVFDSCR
jgi:hypothetical protein